MIRNQHGQGKELHEESMPMCLKFDYLDYCTSLPKKCTAESRSVTWNSSCATETDVFVMKFVAALMDIKSENSEQERAHDRRKPNSHHEKDYPQDSTASAKFEQEEQE